MPRINIFAHKQASQVFDGLINSITNEIKEKEDDYKLNIDENEWEKYFVEKFELSPLKIYPDKARVEFAGKEKRFAEQFGQRGENFFSYIFNFPDDSQKLVYTEIMAFAFTK